ncbi:MAG: 50S ribosomal protein L17 [Dehalococcoidia bacterium]
MRHRVAGRHLGRDTAHRISLYRNLVTDLLRYERITTTEAKAKEIRPMAEKIITLARKGDLHSRRQAQRFVFDPRVVKKTFDEIGPRMRDRPGGYLRITSLEPRKGDGARMAAIELVDYVEAPPTPRPQRVTAAPSAIASGPAVLDAPEAPAVPEPDGQVEEEAEDKRDLMDRMIDKSDEAESEVATEAEVEAEAPAAEAPETEIEAEAQQEAVEAEAEAEVDADAEAAEAADAEAAEAQEAPERPEGQAPA